MALHRSSMQEYFEQNAVCNVQCLKVSQKQTRVALLLDSLVDKLRHMKSNPEYYSVRRVTGVHLTQGSQHHSA